MYAVLLFIVIIGIISMPFMKLFHKIDFLRIAPLFSGRTRIFFVFLRYILGKTLRLQSEQLQTSSLGPLFPSQCFFYFEGIPSFSEKKKEKDFLMMVLSVPCRGSSIVWCVAQRETGIKADWEKRI